MSHVCRIAFFVKKWKSHDAIDISSGGREGPPLTGPSPDEPFLYDGRHRFIAAVLRGAKTIQANFWFHRSTDMLSPQMIDYLTGKTDTKPGSASA